MIFDEIPTELKEHIFTYVTPNEWINTAKVSKEWLELTLGSIHKIESCHLLILRHLAKFINEQRNTNHKWFSLLAMMPKLKHLECCKSTKAKNVQAFWREVSPICRQLKVLDCTLMKIKSFDWNELDIGFDNLVELRWDGGCEGLAFLLRIFEMAPQLEKLTIKDVKINAEWKTKIPKRVKHLLLDDVRSLDERKSSIFNLCEDTSTLETFSALCERSDVVSHFFDGIRLKKLELNHPNASDVLKSAFTKCPNLETVCIKRKQIRITDKWRKCITANVKSFKAYEMSVENHVRPDFSFNWLFQNYGALQSLDVRCVNWIGVDPLKFHSSKNLKKLVLDNYMTFADDDEDEPIDPFPGICYRMIGGSHLVDVELHGPLMDESWRQIFPPTIRRLKLDSFWLSEEATGVFSPQFICENPSNIELLFLRHADGDLPAMDLNAFNGMHKLAELHLIYLNVSAKSLQSILVHCFALSDLVLHDIQSGALTNIPHNLVLQSLRKLCVKEPVDQPSLLLQHFPKMRKVDIAILPTKECWLEVMNSLQEVETAEISVMGPSFDLLGSLIENIDDTKFQYSCLSKQGPGYSFHLTNSLLDALSKVYRFPFRVKRGVLWTSNYPTLPSLRNNVSTLLSSMDQSSKLYHEVMARVNDEWDYDSDISSDDDDSGDNDDSEDDDGDYE